jgi:hypothetical protein
VRVLHNGTIAQEEFIINKREPEGLFLDQHLIKVSESTSIDYIELKHVKPLQYLQIYNYIRQFLFCFAVA